MKRRTFLKTTALATAGLLTPPWFVACRHLATTEGSDPQLTVLPPGEPLPGQPQPAEIPLLVLEGSPRRRGRVHGEERRESIHAVMDLWKDLLERSHETDPDAYLKEFVAKTRFRDAIEKWTPDLMDEVIGLSEGAAIPLETMLAYQYVDEEWWYGRNRSLGIDLSPAAKCSVCAVYGQENTPPLLGQNLDMLSYVHGHHLLLHIREPRIGLESFVLTYSGLIGTCGLNSRSVGICVNALLQLDQRIDGLPVAFVVRGVLNQRSHDAALQFVEHVDHASGQCYTIGGPDRIDCLECSAHAKAPVTPAGNTTQICHANHPLASEDQAIYREIIKTIPKERLEAGARDSRLRVEAMQRRLDDAEVATVATLRAALGSHDDPVSSVCRHRPHDGRLGVESVGIIMELSRPPRLYLSAVPPCSQRFTVHSF